MQVVVEAETETWVTRERDTSDSWDTGDTSGRVSNVSARTVRDGESSYSYGATWQGELDVAVGDNVYAVVADYESGSTFGRDGGYAQVIEVFTDSTEAELCAIAARGQRMDRGYPTYDQSYSFEYDGRTYSRSWTGYFESLNNIEIWECTVRNGVALGDGHIKYRRGN